MGTDPAPDNVGLTHTDWLTVLEGGSPVVCPCHLKDPGRAFDALDTKPGPEPSATSQVLNEVCNGFQEGRLLAGRQGAEVVGEPCQPRVSGHGSL